MFQNCQCNSPREKPVEIKLCGQNEMIYLNRKVQFCEANIYSMNDECSCISRRLENSSQTEDFICSDEQKSNKNVCRFTVDAYFT